MEVQNGAYTQAFIIAALLNLAGIVVFSVFMYLRKKKLSSPELNSKLKENYIYKRKTIL